MNNLRERLNLIMEELGYEDVVSGKSDKQLMEMLEEAFVPLSEIDETQPYELIKYELRDVFWYKHWVPLSTFVSEEQVEKMYHLLCEYKQLLE
jgi:hypothetical protein